MNHQHPHTQEQVAGNISLAFFLNLGFAAIELVGGLLTNSVAILSDAFHDATDCVALGVSWRLQKIAARGRNCRYSYGYRRFSLLGALFISAALLVGSAFIISESIARIAAPEPAHAPGMLALAVLGIVINGLAALRMKRGASLNERALFLHIMEDVLGWIAVLIASLVMLFVEIPVIDPILSLCICAWVVYNVCRNLRSTLRVMLQGVPGTIDVKRLGTALRAVEHVFDIHDLHLWTLDGEQHIMTLHVLIDTHLTAAERSAMTTALRAVCREFGINHVTIETETETEIDPCAEDCILP
jgi:cobalt-zinc-cadmium efflux system protein